jgi:hypothetical protein
MSIVGGAVVTLIWTELLHWIVRRQFRKGPEPSRIRPLPAISGLLERAVVTALVIWIPAGTGPFMGTWIVAKAAGGWAFVARPQGYTDDHEKALYFVGLLGSLVSLGWALGWGLWAPPGHR